MTTTVSERGLEQLICERSFPAFQAYTKILEPPVPGVSGSGGIVSRQPWPHLEELDAALVAHQLILVGKARQLGITWEVADYLAWRGIYTPGSDWLMLSRTEPDAFDFLGRIPVILETLPRHLSAEIRKQSAGSLILANGSRFTAMASTENAGRGHTYSGVVQDEADFHPYLAQNFAAVKPTIDAGGQYTMVSTPDKGTMDTLFKGLLRGAPENGWHRLAFGWECRPGRDKAWWQKTHDEAPASSGMTPDLYMEQEYPKDLMEMLRPTRAMAFLDPDAVGCMVADCSDPTMTLGGLVRIWKPPMVAVKYVGFGDVCWGHHSAFSCFVLADQKTGVQVAEIYGRPEHDEYAQAIADLTKQYNSAYFGIEANGETTERSGLNVVNKLIDLGLGHRMYHHGKNWQQDERDRGWLTTGVNRSSMLAELAEAVRGRAIVPRCKDAVSEMSTAIRTEQGRAQAAGGALFDHVMAWAGLWQMKDVARYNDSLMVPMLRGRRY